jgi:hypothetical protein
MTQLKQPGPISFDLPGKLRRRHPLGDSTQNDHQFARRTMGPLKHGAREGVEDASTGITLIIQHRPAMPPMHA